MRLVVDLQALQTASKFRGIGRYARSLTRALLRCQGEHEIWVAVRNAPEAELAEIRGYFADLLPPVRFHVFSLFDAINYSNQTNAWQREISECVRALSLALLRPDFVLTPSMIEGFDDAVATSCKPILSYENCAIVHDLIPFHDPDPYIGTEAAHRWYQEKLAELLLSDFLFCNSEYTRKDFLDSLNFPSERIYAISAASEYQTETDIRPVDDQKILRDLNIHGAYFLHVGSLERRKNPELLLRAFSLLSAAHRKEIKIIFAGGVSPADKDRVEKYARALGIKPEAHLLFLGFVTEPVLATLYRCCTLFIFPSLSEGFGLPVLEAMACGAPTLSSNSTSLPEVIGRTDMLFDPHDAAGLRTKIVDVLDKPERRAELVAYGLTRSRAFSWDRTAQQIIEVLAARASERARLGAAPSRNREYFDYLRVVANITDVLLRYGVDESGCRAVSELIQKNLNTARRSGMEIAPPSWRVEGPFDSNYSLALVNRETARALERLGVDASLFSTEGPGDFAPNPEFLRRTPDIDRLYRRGADANAQFAVVSRSLFPPRVTRMNGAINLLHHYAWEESGIPQEWIDNFNAELNGFTCSSQHVRKILIDHGLRLPIAVTGNGVDHWERIEPAANFILEAKEYRFLHVSSCFPRKGVDCLLEAYGDAFRKRDDVSLIIKTAHNPHNTVVDDVARLRAADPEFPDVVIIDRDLTEAEIKALYRQCHALVAPSRAEGFGLPIAEAILEGLPVIVTGWSGQLDFCNADTAWLIDFRFERARTHFNLRTSVWAEPSVAHLSALLREVRDAPADEIRKRNLAGKEWLQGSFSWAHVAWRLQQYVADLISFSARTRPSAKIGWVSSWNTRCGIASYSHYMLGDRTDVPIFAHFTDAPEFSDGPNVERDWIRSAGSLDQLLGDIEDCGCDVVVVQFNYAFFVFSELANFLERLIERGHVVVFEVHAAHEKDLDPTKRLSDIVPILTRCDRILVHSIGDLNRLKEMGLVKNVTLFPHPYVSLADQRQAVPRQDQHRFAGKRLIASYGFFLPNKGLLELIQAFAQLVEGGLDAHLVLVNAEYPELISHKLIEKAKELIASPTLQERVTLVTDFLTDEESLSHLRDADLIVLPYQKDTGDSASGAIRLCLASGRPIAVTPLTIFDDVENAVLRLPGCEIADLAKGIAGILTEIESASPQIEKVIGEGKRLTNEFSFARMSKRYFGMLEALCINRLFDGYTKKETGKLNVRLPTRTREFRARDGLIKTRVGQLDDQGHLRSAGDAGILTYGPYALLRPAHYRLIAFGKWVSTGEKYAQFRIVTDKGSTVLHELTVRTPEGTADGCLFDTEFVVDRVHEGTEFILTVDSGVQLSLSSYVLEEKSGRAN